MAIARKLMILAAAVMLAGCGDRHLIINIDVLSYLDASVTQFSVGPVPPSPSGGFFSGEIPLVQNSTVNLIDGTSSIASVEDLTIRWRVVATGHTGSGADTLRLYMGEQGQDPVVMGPVAVVPVAFSAGVSDTIDVQTVGDPRVAELFTGQTMLVTLTNSVRGPEFGDVLNADIELIRLDATVVAGRRNF